MPKQVDHHERRTSIAHALWRVVDQQGWMKATMREVAREAGVSRGQLQHYFSSRAEMLTFAMEFASEQTSRRVERGLRSLSSPRIPATCCDWQSRSCSLSDPTLVPPAA